MGSFRFGVNFSSPAAVDDWPEQCRTAERLGYDAVLAPDHLGAPSPFAMLAAAAVASERLRLGTYVLNNGFWNPAIMAREAATVDRLSGGRLELGLGLGHMKSEHDSAGIPWEDYSTRVARLERTIGELDRLFAEDGQKPLPRQCPRPPLMIGGHGERSLALAARHADIVAFTGAIQRPKAKLGELLMVGADELRRRVDFVHEQAGARASALEFSALIQAVVVTDSGEAAAAEVAHQYGEKVGLATARAVLDNPFVLVGTVEEIATEIVRNRERYGFSYLVVHGHYRDALAEVIPRVRELARAEETGERAASPVS